MHIKSSKDILASGKFLNLVRQDQWEYAERNSSPGVVAILAITADQKLILTEQYRLPVKMRVIDLPAGLIERREGKSETPQVAAERELIEETGFRAAELRKILEFPSSAGMSSEMVTLFQASQVERLDDGGGLADENITVHMVPLNEVDMWLSKLRLAGAAIDPKVYVGLYWIYRRKSLGFYGSLASS